MHYAKRRSYDKPKLKTAITGLCFFVTVGINFFVFQERGPLREWEKVAPGGAIRFDFSFAVNLAGVCSRCFDAGAKEYA